MSTKLRNRRHRRGASAPRSRPWAEPLEDRLALSAPPIGPDFLAGTPADSDPEAEGPIVPAQVAVASDAAGNFVVVWTNFYSENDREGYDVYLSRFDPVGNPLSGAIKVNDSDIPRFAPPSIDISMTPGGEFVVVFSADGDVLGQRYSADAQDQGDNFQIDLADANADQPRVAMIDEDTFAVTYVNRNDGDLTFLLFEGIAPPTVVDVNGAAPTQMVFQGQGLASDGLGTFVVTWDTFNGEVLARRVVAGAPDVDIITVDTGGSGYSAPDVDIGGGQFVVVWTEFGPTGVDVRGRRFSLGGLALAAEFVAGSVGFGEDVTRPHVNVSPADDFQVVWVTQFTPQSVYVATFFPGGGIDAAPSVVNVQFGHSFGAVADVTGDGASNFVIAFPGPLGTRDNVVAGAAFARIYRQNPPDIPDTPSVPFVFDDRALAIALANAPRPIDYLLPFGALPDLPNAPFLAPVPPPGRALFQSAFEQNSASLGVGQISGKVFEDLNGNGVQDPGEPAIEGQFVFLDLNRNARWEGGEPFTYSDADGFYLFEYLALDRYVLWQDLERMPIEQTAPAENKPYEVTLTAAQPAMTEVNFGDKMLGRIQPTVGPIDRKETPPRPLPPPSLQEFPERVPAPGSNNTAPPSPEKVPAPVPGSLAD